MGQAPNLVFLGVRGSVPIDGPAFSRFGGATSCVLVRMGGQLLILDAGTGLMGLGRWLDPAETECHLLLSHPHLDHLFGLPCCSILFDSSRRLTLYAAPRGGLSARAQVRALMSPPLWPVGPEVFRAAVSFRDLETQPFDIGPVRVETMEGCHPGGCTVFRLSHGSSSLVYATDFELTQESAARLAAFSKNCSLLLCDGQYAPNEAAGMRGFGHADWDAACRVARDCGAGRLIIIHHDPTRTDDVLVETETQIQTGMPWVSFARDGEEVSF